MVANLTYLRHDQNNLSGSAITASSSNSSYPLSNLNSLPISKPFRFTGATSENLQIDLGSAKTISLVALVNHNLTSAATITINAGASANPDGSTFTTTIPWKLYDAWKVLNPAQTYRYWKIIIADSSNPNAFIQLGYGLMGTAIVLSANFSNQWQFSEQYENLEVQSEYGTPHVVKLFKRIQLDLPFQNIQEADGAVLRALITALNRNVTPLFLIPDSSRTDAIFCRLESNLDRTIDVNYLQTTTLSFVEEGRGKLLN
jgi:hypothetical protein